MVKIITDSAADLEPEELQRLNVDCVPFTISFGRQEYQENENLTKTQFYNLIRTEKSFPHTSQPGPFAYVSALEKAQQEGDEAVVITISSALSGSCQGAVAAKDILEYEQCHIVDSLNATGGQRILVEQAAKLRDEGKSAKEIAAVLEKMRSKVTLYACINTLEFLYRGGRLPKTSYALGTAAQVKPILRVLPDGRAEIPTKTLGMKRGMAYLWNQINSKLPDPAYPLYVLYTGIQKSGNALREFLNEKGLFIPAERMMEVGATIGSHIGPNACGVVYVAAQ